MVIPHKCCYRTSHVSTPEYGTLSRGPDLRYNFPELPHSTDREVMALVALHVFKFRAQSPLQSKWADLSSFSHAFRTWVLSYPTPLPVSILVLCPLVVQTAWRLNREHGVFQFLQRKVPLRTHGSREVRVSAVAGLHGFGRSCASYLLWGLSARPGDCWRAPPESNGES